MIIVVVQTTTGSVSGLLINNIIIACPFSIIILLRYYIAKSQPSANAGLIKVPRFFLIFLIVFELYESDMQLIPAMDEQ